MNRHTSKRTNRKHASHTAAFDSGRAETLKGPIEKINHPQYNMICSDTPAFPLLLPKERSFLYMLRHLFT